MWKLKGCPKCGGDVFLEKDTSGWYERCLQCGYNRDMAVVFEAKQPAGKKKEPVLQRR